ncbi:MAG: NAD(P)H-quinone oxidoreductase subunit 3 [Sulfurimonas sp.]|nr:NAD(P)H-quinone oxidoreductase subunit 3 [Sulfurimonas sp.]
MEHITTANPYFGVFVLFIVTFSAFIGTTIIARFVSRALAAKNSEKIKLSVYECGPEVTKQPNRVSPQFYLFALLFLLFDVEIIFMFPWAVNYQALGWFGFIEMILFILLLTIGFVYAWKKGALEWHNIK